MAYVYTIAATQFHVRIFSCINSRLSIPMYSFAISHARFNFLKINDEPPLSQQSPNLGRHCWAHRIVSNILRQESSADTPSMTELWYKYHDLPQTQLLLEGQNNISLQTQPLEYLLYTKGKKINICGSMQLFTLFGNN